MTTQLALLMLLIASSPICAQGAAASAGSICGNVQDENGAPASLVRVVAIYVGGPHTGPYPVGVTDTRGHYCIIDVANGDYAMSADDPEKAYPEMGSMFFSPALPGPRITVIAGQDAANVDFRIPYKAGIVRVQLTDAATGKPIVAMLFSLIVRSDATHRYIHGSCYSTRPLLLPPDQDVSFSVRATGYREWPGDGTDGRLLNLLPGTTTEFKIALWPTSP